MKSRTLGYVLALFLGGIGAHAFYYRRYVRGSLYLLFCWTYIPVLLGWIDILFINRWHNRIQEDGFINKIGEKIHTKGTSTKQTNQEKKINMSGIVEVKSENSTLSSEAKILKEGSKDLFYNEKKIILTKYNRIQTPKEIVKEIEEINNPKTNSVDGVNITISFSNTGTILAKDSIKYANKKGKKCEAVPLFAYWTTFEKLDGSQKKWYFYWREQVLNGKYPDTDLSYVILFMYELMNYTFNQSSAFNISMMVRLHGAYQERIPKLSNYSVRWIADILYEVKEEKLAHEWDVEKIHLPTLYQKLQVQKEELEKISITVWKPYIQSNRETEFFKKHRDKIYKKFKSSIPLLQDIYQTENIELIDRWFILEKSMESRYLFQSVVLGRNNPIVQAEVVRIKPTKELYEEVTALYKLSENVVRRLHNEKREIKTNEEALPKGFKETMLNHKRFKVVHQSNQQEKGELIPPAPQEEQKKKTKSMINFDDEIIKGQEQEMEEIIKLFNVDNDTEEKIRLSKAIVEVTEPKGKTEERREGLEFETIEYSFVDTPFLQSGISKKGEEKFLETLTDIQKEFLALFEKRSLSEIIANSFVKKKGFMLGTFMSDLNEKAYEYIGDNLLEHLNGEIMVYEEYEQILTKVKEFSL